MSDASQDFCLGELKAHDHPRFLSALFAPADRRPGLSALYAFNLEIAKTRAVVREPMMGQIRLQWWRDAIDEIFEGKPVRKHQVVQPLAGAIVRYSLPRVRFDRMIDAREADLEPHPPGTIEAFEAYVADTAGELGELVAQILGADAEKTRIAAEAYGFAGLLLAIPYRASAGRIDLPLDKIAEHGLTARDIRDGTRQEKLPALIEDLSNLATSRLVKLTGRHRKSDMPALLSAILAQRELKRIRQAGWNPFQVAPDSPLFVILRMIKSIFFKKL
jgi:phytoene synthase